MATESSILAVVRASRPKFRNSNDKIAFVVHAAFLSAGYSLIATGDKAFAEDPPVDGEEIGIDGWNSLEDGYAFVYVKSENGDKKSILVKCLTIGYALVVDVLDLKDDSKKPLHIQINVKDYITEENRSNYGDMYKNLQGLVQILNAGIFNKLETKTGSSSAGNSSKVSKENTANETTGVFPDERRQPPPVLRYPPIPATGGSDVFPGPCAGVLPDRGPGMGGGMLVGPNDPRFFPMGGRPGLDFPGGSLVPPGARFDPIGPPDVPGFGPQHFVRRPPNRGGGGGGVHPDLQHFQDPDYI